MEQNGMKAKLYNYLMTNTIFLALSFNLLAQKDFQN